ncbi:hypothetical protein OEZ85_002930 [Tetradesmus obliquus]|uniref:J domain-containing protein n=1 Tax=Tetradesmus obliquus TaxID=3088 RepID=A0ABY8TZV3_TETOB|nr:hypothetical protein OEZ85_002930 [Tetradesmus obliquus]
MDMAEQNAKLVAAYVEKKREVKQLQRGNAAYQAQQYRQALEAYSDALALNVEEPTLNAVLLCNRAAALHACGQYLEAIADCCMAAQLDGKYPRVLQRRAEAYIAIEDYSSAVADLQQLVQLCGGGSSSSSCREAAIRLRDAQQRQRLQGSAGPNYYSVLGLQQGCSSAEVKAAYRKLALKHHPDKATGPSAKAAAEVVFVLITAANAVLADPAKRAQHDAARLMIKARMRGSAGTSSSSSPTAAAAGRAHMQAEKAELRDLLESANSQREEYRKAADIASRRAEQLSKQLEMRLQELNELSGLYTAVQQHEDRLLHENEGLQQQIAGYKQSLSKAAAHQEDLSRKLQKEAAARKQAETDLRKLHKEREYLKMRVDRMQHALSILENVMDDTLRVSQGMSSSEGGLKGHHNSAAALRQSMDTASVQQLQDLIQSTKLMGDTSSNGDQLGIA